MNSDVIGRDKIALVTGGSSGIGLATARLLAIQGNHVWLVARNKERLNSARDEVEKVRLSVAQHIGMTSADVSDPAQAAMAVKQVTDELGVPHLIINNAGVTRPGYVQDLDLDIFRLMMDINFFGTVHITKAVLPEMLKRGSGYIVNVASFVAIIGIYGYSAYGASKSAVLGFSDILRDEMKPHGILVSIVLPVDVDTPQLADEKQYRPPESVSLASLGKPMPPETVARSIVRGVRRGTYLIIPGFEGNFLYRLKGLLGRAYYPVMDLFVKWASRNGRHKTYGQGDT